MQVVGSKPKAQRNNKPRSASAKTPAPGAHKTSRLPPKKQPFLTVGIGASAGGLAAFKSFFANMPADTGMAFVLVQHLDPHHNSLLVELLRPYASMPVMEARDRFKVEKNHIFVIPPDTTLTMEGDVLRVSSPAPERAQRRPIDTFFFSLAENREDCAVAIILSGVGSDGTLGVKAIKEHGGFTLAQAQFDATAMSGMPQSAVATGLVDCVLAVEAMPAKLVEYQCHLGEVEECKDPDGIRDDAKEHLAGITSLLRQRIKHDFSGYKPNTLIRRIQRRMQVLQIETVPAYVEHLRREKEESDVLFRELLIGVTRFFRDEDAFEALKTTILPSLLANKNANEPIRVWVAGCATGEEVYSIAILLQETLEEHNAVHPIAVFGTDIDTQAIAFARAARYRKMDGLSPNRLDRWFVKDKEDYCPIATIRNMCVFSEHSVVKDPPFSKLDLASCRNVLIYLDSDLQHRVMQTFHYALRQGGYLFLGPSESVNREATLFAVVDKKHRILQRQDHVRATLPEFQPGALARTIESAPPLAAHVEDRLDRSARRIMNKHSPAYLVIDKKHDILRFSGGEAGPYLEPSSGTASLNLFSILRKALRSQVRAAVQRSFDTHHTVMDENLAIRIDGQRRSITLIVEPIVESTLPGELFVVAFRERGRLPDMAEGADTSAVSDPNAGAFQQELRAAKAQAQASSDELENHIEAMKSITEEYQSVNEELQSSNEELETSKEEMQSVNEELQTVNNELQGKNEQLTHVNNDLQNLLDSTQIATIFLDDNLRIRNFTPAAMDLFPLRDSDRGRALTEIVTRLTYDELRDDVRKVQRTLSAVEHEVTLKDESATFIMRIRPYRTVANVITGVVITFTDITQRRRQDDHVQALMKEMQHRTNNLFAVIQAMARQTVKHSADLTDFEARFGNRIQGLSHSNDLLIKQEWQGVRLDELIHAQLAPFVESDRKLLEMDGPAVIMATNVVQTLGLGLHELATNASKYGALSVPEGKILLHWKFYEGTSEPKLFRLIWRERGGPTVKPPKRNGFGSFVLVQMMKRGIDANIKIDFAPDGVIWTLDMPASYAVPVE